MTVILATRSPGKLREIRAILGGTGGVRLIDLNEAGVPESPEEAEVEAFDTFEENAVAKARYFAGRTGLPVLADDSGLEVDALGGAPGVRSKRFAPAEGGPSGAEQDRRNNQHLLERLEGIGPSRRGARYVCVAAFLEAVDTEPVIARGEAPGRILEAPRGEEGFGYDPIMLDPESGRSFAELSPEEKNVRSHRGRAFTRLAGQLGWR